MKIQIHGEEGRHQHIDDFREKIAGQNLKYFASDVAEEAEFLSDEELENAVKRSMQVCRAMQIPIRDHFQAMVQNTPHGSINDWRISALGYALIHLNGHTDNPNVAKMQIDLLRRGFRY